MKLILSHFCSKNRSFYTFEERTVCFQVLSAFSGKESKEFFRIHCERLCYLGLLEAVDE